MPNDYTFTLEDIQDFVSTQSNLEESSDTTVGEEQLDLLYRFPDGRPTIGFRRLAKNVYERAFLDPSIEQKWFEHMA